MTTLKNQKYNIKQHLRISISKKKHLTDDYLVFMLILYFNEL
jgi:hypothetical protein